MTRECGDDQSLYCLWPGVLILVFHSVTPIWSHSLLSSSVYSKVMNSKKEWQGYLEIRTRKLVTIGFLVFIMCVLWLGSLTLTAPGFTSSPDD